MKKIIAVVLVLCFALTAVTALAETRTFMLCGVMDPEGNTVSYEDDPTFPILVFSVDDEAMVCAFGTEEEMIAGTCAVIEQTENTVTLAVSLENGEEITLIYVGTEDAFAYVDGEGYTYVMQMVDDVEQAA